MGKYANGGTNAARMAIQHKLNSYLLVGQMPSPDGQQRTGQIDGVYKVFGLRLCPAPKLFLTPVVH